MKFFLSILLAFASVVALKAQTNDSVPATAVESTEAAAQAAPGAPVDASAAPVDGAATEKPAAPVKVDAEKLAQQADSAYSKDNYILAESLYLQALKVGGSSSTLFYNLGNAYYRQGMYGKAIVNYERALKLDPTNGDARANLEFVNSKITDKQIDNGSYMSSLWDGLVSLFTANGWAILSLVLFALFLGGAALYIFSTTIVVKKASFFGGLIVLVLTVISTIVAFDAADRVNSNRYAIIIPPAAQLSTSPREARSQSEQAFLLHEGTKVEVIDSLSTAGEGTWYEVVVGRGDRAWIPATAVERI
jgi:tetratricopeptide (TPR) repeat protein